MANTKSAKKAIRVSARKAKVNKKVKESFRGVKKDLVKKLSSGDKKTASELMPKYQSEIDKAVKKGVLKKNTGSRMKSRITKLVVKAK